VPNNPFFDPFGQGVNQRLRQMIFPGDAEDEPDVEKILEDAEATIKERDAVVFIGYSLSYDDLASHVLRRATNGKRIEVYSRSRETLAGC
jgi:hypothetical protein